MGPEPTPDLRLEGLVHDLNNVLETISDAADLFAENPGQARVAAVIHRSVSRGRRILDTHSAISGGNLEFAPILESAIEFTRDLLAAVHAPPVEFAIRVEPGLRVGGSATAWERVLLNLFVNAAQAMKGSGTVEIEARATATGAEVRVSDHGPGIPAEILPQIFEAHFSTKSANSGLGLQIVKSLVVQHGGEVSASNRTDGTGATFVIHMPAR